MELLAVVLFALSYMVLPCNCIGVCSPATYEFRLSKDGAFHFPVFHREHPCLNPSPPVHHAASLSDAGTVVGNDKIHRGKYFMAINLGTPAIFNLVTIDTGSTLSWVNCERCQISCHEQAQEAGPRFVPDSSATYRQIGCSSEDCIDVHVDNGVPYGCIDDDDDETDSTCLYSVRYGSQYSAGKLGRDRLALGDNFTVVDDFVFGCNMDDKFYGSEAGVIGFGNKSYSFFNQMARQTSYSAFAYCFPGDHRSEGFLIVGPYPQRLELVTPLIRGYGRRWHVYSLLMLDMAVDGKRLQVDVDPSTDTRQIMVVDSGTDDTFISSPAFYALAEAVASAMGDRGYYREYGSEKVCFRPAGGGEPVNWGGLPVVEMLLLRATLKLPPENVFYQQSADRLCLAFQPDTNGVRDVRILGNRALRSFRVVYDMQKMTFGFQARAC